MSALEVVRMRPWAPHPQAAPLTEESGDRLTIGANGTRTCVGGWQIDYAGVEAGETYCIQTRVRFSDVDAWRDRLQCPVYWRRNGVDGEHGSLEDIVEWDYLVPAVSGDGHVVFSRTLTAPEGTEVLSVRFTFRWTREGRSEWSMPGIEVAAPEPWPAASTIAVVTGRVGDFAGTERTVEGNVDYYARLCEKACADDPDLIVLPEIAVQYGVQGSPIDLAVPLDGPEAGRFREIARENGTRILLGLLEREDDAVYNSAVLIGDDGEFEGTYRKVHLAVSEEMDSGILPGESFPVFETGMGRIGCNICMDSSAAESSRMVGLNGADFLLLPIMGDHRAWHPEDHTWDPERFRGIMQTRAMDNQLCVVVAVNRGEGSCVIDRTGHVLAWNDGSAEIVAARVDLDDGFRPSSKGCYRGVNWMQRRPHVYGAFVDPTNAGSLT